MVTKKPKLLAMDSSKGSEKNKEMVSLSNLGSEMYRSSQQDDDDLYNTDGETIGNESLEPRDSNNGRIGSKNFAQGGGAQHESKKKQNTLTLEIYKELYPQSEGAQEINQLTPDQKLKILKQIPEHIK